MPLFELYTRLQEAGLPLGLHEYAQVVKALQAGFGLPNEQALARLCRTLWVKNEEEEHILNYHFAEVIGVKPISYIEVAKASAQQAVLHREVVVVQKLTAQTSRNALLGVITALVLFLITLAGAQLLPSRPESLPSGDTPTEGEETPVQPGTPAINSPIPPAEEVPQVSVVLLSSLIGSMLLGTGVSWLLIRRLMVLQDALPNSDTDDFTTQTTVSRTEMMHTEDDEIQLAEAIRKTTEQEIATSSIKILRRDEYFPLTRRQMKQGWRYLRRNSREGPKTELDVNGTVAQIGRRGMFTEPVMRAARSNLTDLVFLLDQDGSMVPFHGLSKRLMDTAVRAGHLGQAGIYYFHNCPVNYLYHDPLMQEPKPLNSFLSGRLSSKSVVVIVSDAGAARGGYNPARIRKTEVFLAQLSQYIRYVVWLNPLPRIRWEQTTAGEIAKFVAMFEVDRAGMQGAINILRGRWKPSLRTPRVAL